jgi:hypothetical protein
MSPDHPVWNLEELKAAIIAVRTGPWRRWRSAPGAFVGRRRRPQAGEQMGLAGAAITYKDNRLRFPDVVALSKFVDLLGRDLGIAREVEPTPRRPRRLPIAMRLLPRLCAASSACSTPCPSSTPALSADRRFPARRIRVPDRASTPLGRTLIGSKPAHAAVSLIASENRGCGRLGGGGS